MSERTVMDLIDWALLALLPLATAAIRVIGRQARRLDPHAKPGTNGK